MVCCAGKSDDAKGVEKMDSLELTWGALEAQDDRSTSLVIGALSGNAAFDQLSSAETADIVQRDAGDAAALATGIKLAQEKGVLELQEKPPSYAQVDVMGKTAAEVARGAVDKDPGAADSRYSRAGQDKPSLS